MQELKIAKFAKKKKLNVRIEKRLRRKNKGEPC